MINTQAYIENFLKIKDKKTHIVNFRLNTAQQKLYDAVKKQYAQKKPVRVIILKARQMGFSTLVEAMLFKDTATQGNINSGIVAHESNATSNLFKMSKRYYDNLEPIIKPETKASNAKEIIFKFDEGYSSIKCMTAGNENIGRSDTFQNLHISEYAFWGEKKKDIITGLLQAVPNETDTAVFIESTANGYDDFKDRWDAAVAGESDYIPVFCAWWEHEEYRVKAPANFYPTKEEKDLIDLYGLDLEQIAWRRWCIRNNCNGDLDLFRQEYPACPEEAFLMSGRPVFNPETVMLRIAQLEKEQKENPPRVGNFRFNWNNYERKDFILDGTICFDNNKKGAVRIYEEPQKSVPYVIGADTKGEGRDYFAATVINNMTGERAATMHLQSAESKPFTYQLYCLGKYYNNALIGVETNFNTAPVEELERLQYFMQYVRRTYDSYTKREQKRYGFRTDRNTRPLIIDREIDLINNHSELFKDIPMLRECTTFVYDDRGRPDAIAGKHDDLLFSDMIANEIREAQSNVFLEEETEAEAQSVAELDDWLEYGAWV